MRIFLAISPESTWGVNNSKTWMRSLYEPLLDLGYDVFLFRNDIALNKIRKRYFSKFDKFEFSELVLMEFKKQHKKNPFDLFFSYFTDKIIDSSFINEIKKHGVLTCNYSCNNTHQFYLINNISKYYDYNLHSEKKSREKFIGINATPLWFPMGANPNYYKPEKLDIDIDVSFVGQMYAKRPIYIRHLLEKGINVRIYGPGWVPSKSLVKSEFQRLKKMARALLATDIDERARLSGWLFQHDLYRKISVNYKSSFFPPCSDEEMISLYSKSKISLGFSEVFDKNSPEQLVYSHVHLREFEAPMSGAFYCTGYSDEIHDFYEQDKEIVLYYNEEDLLGKVKFYLANPLLANRIRERGYMRALNCHSYHKRFTDLFLEMKLIK